MKEIYVAPTRYNQGAPATITTTLMLHFPLKLSKTSEMQHWSRKTITFFTVSKITALQSNAAENLCSQQQCTHFLCRFSYVDMDSAGA